jgi:hypothetical protein
MSTLVMGMQRTESASSVFAISPPFTQQAWCRLHPAARGCIAMRICTARTLVDSGRQIISMAVGAFHDSALYDRLEAGSTLEDAQPARSWLASPSIVSVAEGRCLSA